MNRIRLTDCHYIMRCTWVYRCVSCGAGAAQAQLHTRQMCLCVSRAIVDIDYRLHTVQSICPGSRSKDGTELGFDSTSPV